MEKNKWFIIIIIIIIKVGIENPSEKQFMENPGQKQSVDGKP